MFATFMLIVIGVLLGGVDVVDMKQDQLWFIAQAGNGPVAFILDYFNQSLLKTTSAETQARLTSLGHLNAIGTLYIALAGLMNIVVVLDVFAGPDRRNDGPARRSSDLSAGPDQQDDGPARRSSDVIASPDRRSSDP